MVVVDNSCLSSLTSIGHLKLLSDLFDVIIIPSLVLEEYNRSWDTELLEPISPTVRSFTTNLPEYSDRLSTADRQCITIAQDLSRGIVTDDNRLRQYCVNNAIPVIGTIGVMKLGYQKDYFGTFETYKKLIFKLSEDLFLTEDIIQFALDV